MPPAARGNASLTATFASLRLFQAAETPSWASRDVTWARPDGGSTVLALPSAVDAWVQAVRESLVATARGGACPYAELCPHAHPHSLGVLFPVWGHSQNPPWVWTAP